MKIKICGIRSKEEAEELKNIKEIDYFGLIFAVNSKRRVSVGLAREISEIFHKAKKKVVGVFLDQSFDEVKNTAKLCKLDVVQLHGKETPDFCRRLGGTIWKAFPIEREIPEITYYLQYIEYPLFDSKGKDNGINGEVFDWDILKNFKNNFVLAGGISIENLKEAWGYSPKILDLNSKFEIDDRKNKPLILEAIRILKDLEK